MGKIGEKCFAFERKWRDKNSAIQYCKNTFGSGQEGRIYEPRDKNLDTDIFAKWETLGYGKGPFIIDVMSNVKFEDNFRDNFKDNFGDKFVDIVF